MSIGISEIDENFYMKFAQMKITQITVYIYVHVYMHTNLWLCTMYLLEYTSVTTYIATAHSLITFKSQFFSREPPSRGHNMDLQPQKRWHSQSYGYAAVRGHPTSRQRGESGEFHA